MNDGETLVEARTLRRAVSRLQRAFRATRDPESPTSAQLSALGTLHRSGPMPTGRLAELERLKPQSVTRLVAALEALHLIDRVPDGADRRRLLVTITAEGRRQLAREVRRRDERLATAIGRLTGRERATIRAACGLIERLAESSAEA